MVGSESSMNRLLHWCCGENKLPPPWENFDIHVDLRSDIRTYYIDLTKPPYPFPDKCASAIFIEHGLEHFTGPQGFKIMQEAYRILVSGGTFRVCVPMLSRLDMLKRRDIIMNHGHLMVYNLDNLGEMLEAAGFRYVEETKRKSWDGHWKKIGELQDDLETLRVEAIS